MRKIEKRGDRWTTFVDLPPDPVTGNRRRRRITAATKKEAEQLVVKTLHDVAGGFVFDEQTTLREFWDRWLASSAPTVKPATLRRYKDLARLHLLPVLGNKRLAKLSAADVAHLHTDRLAYGLSSTSVRHVHGLLHRVLKDAVNWDLIHRNVAEAVAAPKRSTTEAKTWSAEEVERFIAAAEERDDGALWSLAVFTGMRRGELIGLRWTDVDFESRSIYVRRSMSRGADSRLVEGAPKTAKGRRRIALSPWMTDCLKHHQKAQLEHRVKLGPAYENNDLVFPNEWGRPLHPNSFVYRFKAAIKEADLPYIRPHDLRHTSATLMLRQGTHMKIVQERLGHSDIAMTMDLYSHVAPDLQDTAALHLEALLTRNRKKAS
jgi:integrase